jgi:hypothetical protein
MFHQILGKRNVVNYWILALHMLLDWLDEAKEASN